MGGSSVSAPSTQARNVPSMLTMCTGGDVLHQQLAGVYGGAGLPFVCRTFTVTPCQPAASLVSSPFASASLSMLLPSPKAAVPHSIACL